MRPLWGTRARLSSGPWTTAIPLVRASTASASPTALAIEGLKLAAMPMAAENCVTPVRPLATPSGPSVRVIAGMHRDGAPILLFSSGGYVARITKDAFWLSDIFAITSFANWVALAERWSDCVIHGHGLVLAEASSADFALVTLAPPAGNEVTVVARRVEDASIAITSAVRAPRSAGRPLTSTS